MKTQNYKLGKLGEDLARKYLRSKNYNIITSNYHTKYGELDIVASSGEVLVFVEVKLKIGDSFGLPEEMLTKLKVSQVQNTAASFLLEKSDICKKYTSYRIDAVCIVLGQTKEVVRLDHYENITF